MFDWLPARVAQVQTTTLARQQGWRFVLNPAATNEDIRDCEVALGRPLSPSYSAFLSRWNGASLFRRESMLPDGRISVSAEIGIQGTRDVSAFHRDLRANLDFYGDEGWASLLVFCNIPGPGAFYCALNADLTTPEGEYAVVDCHEDFGPRCWQRAMIAPSFEAWLEGAFGAALQGDDPYYWLNLPELDVLYRECLEERQRELAAERQRRRPNP